MQSSTRYSLFSSLMHWLMAALIIAMLFIGWQMGQMPNGSERFELIGLHKSLGVLAILLITLRISGRIMSRISLPNSSPFETAVKHLIHSLLYLMMLIMPLSGLIMSWAGGRATSFFSLFAIPGASEEIPALASTAHSIHVTVIYGFGTLIILHIAAFMYKQFVKKENILRRISLRP